MENNNYKLYIHTAPNGKRYVGITKQRPEQRWGLHGQGYKHNAHFSNAIMKYGWGNFNHEIIKSGLSKLEAEQMEIELIQKYQSNILDYGYNIDRGGNCSGAHSAETIEKIRAANLGANNHMYGRHGTDNPNYSRVEKTCAYCGKTIFIVRAKSQRSLNYYCSLECKHKDQPRTAHHTNIKEPVKCDNCGKEMLRYPSQIKVYNYCSRLCQREHFKLLFSGANNPNYKDGNRMKIN